jgi:hypothetical protein
MLLLQVYIKFSIFETEDMHLSIYDCNGRLLKDINLGQKAVGNYNYQIDLSSFENGIYLLNLVSTKYKSTKQIMKRDANNNRPNNFTD